MGRVPGRHTLFVAVVVAVLTGLADARGWGQFPEFFAGAVPSSSIVHGGARGSSEIPDTVSPRTSPTLCAEVLGRASATVPTVRLTLADRGGAFAVPVALVEVVAAVVIPAHGPTGAGHPLLLGGDLPDAQPPVI